jgi:hypothetical protein
MGESPAPIRQRSEQVLMTHFASSPDEFPVAPTAADPKAIFLEVVRQ